MQEVQLAISGKPDGINLDFWRAVLGYEPNADDNAVDPLGHGSTVWMQELERGQAAAARHAHRRVGRARAPRGAARGGPRSGGRIVDDSEAPRNYVLADAAGNRMDLTAWPDGPGK